MYFLRYSTRGFFLNRDDHTVEIDVCSNILDTFSSVITVQESPLSQNYQTVFFKGKFYFAFDYKLYECTGNQLKAIVPLKRHGTNSLFVVSGKLYFLSYKGEICDVSSLDDAKHVQTLTCGFGKFYVQFCYTRIFIISDNESVHEITLRDEVFEARKLEFRINNIYFASANVIIDLDQVCYDLLDGKRYEPLKQIGNDFYQALIPMEIGWIIDKEYFYEHYGNVFEGIRTNGSAAFYTYLNALFEYIKRENQQ